MQRLSIERPRLLVVWAMLSVMSLILACGAPMSLPIAKGPRWACPSPMPMPFGPAGPVKGQQVVATANPTIGTIEEREPIYYAEWEQEYGPGGSRLDGQPAFTGPPFPSPTPYARNGNTYAMGQRVEVAPLHVLVTAQAQELIGTEQVYLIDLTWHNPTDTEVPFTPAAQVWLRTITRADGTQQSSDGWGVRYQAAAQYGLTIPTAIPRGTSTMRVPILAPAGEPHVIELRMPIMLPTPTLANDTRPTPNSDLRSPQNRTLVVQWVNSPLVGPPCDDPGALTAWVDSDSEKAIPRDAMVELVAPPGAPRVVALALAQVGKRYMWGATGPDSFDCSGLMQWSYAQIGIAIPRTSGEQWRGLRAIPLSEAQPGDMVYMDTRDGISSPQRVTHVGMLADLDRDGHWDMIHAASPALGVRVEYRVLASSYYAWRMFPTASTAR